MHGDNVIEGDTKPLQQLKGSLDGALERIMRWLRSTGSGNVIYYGNL